MKVSMSRMQQKEVEAGEGFDFMKFVNDGWSIDYIDGTLVAGMCEDCTRPILEGEEYNCDEEGITWHKSCTK